MGPSRTARLLPAIALALSLLTAPSLAQSTATPAPQPGASAPATPPAAADAEAKRRREEVGELYTGDPELDPKRAEVEERSFGWVAFQTFLALGIVILLVYVVLNYGLRRMMGLRPVSGGAAGRMVRMVEVVERIPLDQKKALFVLKVTGEYLLVGGADGGLNLISKLDPDRVANFQRDAEAAKAAAPSLSPFLQKLLSRRGGPPPSTGSTG